MSKFEGDRPSFGARRPWGRPVWAPCLRLSWPGASASRPGSRAGLRRSWLGTSVSRPGPLAGAFVCTSARAAASGLPLRSGSGDPARLRACSDLSSTYAPWSVAPAAAPAVCRRTGGADARGYVLRLVHDLRAVAPAVRGHPIGQFWKRRCLPSDLSSKLPSRPLLLILLALAPIPYGPALTAAAPTGGDWSLRWRRLGLP